MSVNPFAVAFAIFGIPSAASIVLAGVIAWRLATHRVDAPSRALLLTIVAVEIPLFLMSGGLTLFDPYALGYSGLAVPALMALLILIGWALRALDITAWIGLTALLYAVDAYGTRNIWDYLIDPVVALVALVWLVVVLAKGRTRRRAARGNLA